MKDNNKGLPTGLKIAAFVTGGVVAIGLAVYIGYAVFFTSHFLPNTYFGDENVGFKSLDSVVEEHKSQVGDYSLVITARPKDTEYTISGSDFSYSYKDTGEEKRLLKSQSAFSWPSAMFGKKRTVFTLEDSTDYDSAALETAVTSLKIFDESYYEAPKDASIEITDEGYEVEEEKQGYEPIKDKVMSEVEAAVSAASDNVTLSDDCYVKPEVTADAESITEITDKLDAYLAATVKYQVEDNETTLKGGEILSLLSIDTVGGNVSINDEALTEYVYQLARKYNTFGRERQFTTSLGDVVTIGGGDYGWVVDKEGEAEQLKSDLEGGEAVEREPVYEQTALYRGADDIGKTYVELDYTNQHMYYYVDGERKFEADIVSGKLSNGNGSPDGVYKIVYKSSPAELVGETYDTKVEYFIPFAYNVGFHDATWQPYFGGDRYLSNGSHGCINMSLDSVAQFYGMIEEGTPVIAYYRSEVSLWSESARISNAYSYTAQ